MVSNEDPSGGVHPADDLKTLQLVANQLWHTDGTFLPVPALANILQARVVSSEGGETELVSTRAGFSRLAPEMQDRLRGMVFRHRYAQSRAKVDRRLAEESYIRKWPDQRWRAVLTNPVTGAQSLYIASHVCGIDGMAPDAALAMIDELTEAMTAPEAIYAHRWTPGDVLIWDERATLHRGRPWPYDLFDPQISTAGWDLGA
jgi:alpha-ketoglutarate-dependent 2,4-dichlorophenoxyacetate dioxygenase